MQKGMTFCPDILKDRTAPDGIRDVQATYSPSVVDFHHRGL